MPTLPNSPPATILYVESDLASRTMLAQLLRQKGFQVLEAGTGREALQLAEERPDLILLDVHPPDADAFDLCGQFKSTPITASVPVLLFSGIHVKSEDRIRGLEGGADGYLTKPVEPPEVLAQIKALLRARRAEEALARLAAIVDSSEDAVIGEALDGTITSWNAGAECLYGYTTQDALGQPISILAPSAHLDEKQALLERLQRGERIASFETVRVRKDGSQVDVSVSVSPIKDAGNRIIGAAKIARDISDRKRAEKERDAVLARLQMQIERMPLAYITYDADLRVTDWNPAAEKIFGFRKEEVLGREPAELIGPPDVLAKGGEALLRRSKAGDESAHGVNANRTKDGRTIACQWFNTPLLDENGRYTGLLCMALDVTERIAAEEALRLRDHAIQAVTQGIVITDARLPDHPITYVSPGFELLTGYAAAEAVGRNCRFLQGPDTDVATVAKLREAVRTARPCSVEILNYRKDGAVFWNSLSVAPVRDAEGLVTRFIGVQADVTERKQAEASLARLATIVESSEDAIISTTPDGTVVSWNPGAEHIFGYTLAEMVGNNIRVFIPAEQEGADQAIVDRVLQGEHVASFEAARRHKDGRILQTSVTLSAVWGAGAQIVGVVAVIRDVTERRLLEEQVRQIQKMEAIGQLAAGVAHDFNNILQVITGYGELLLATLGSADPAHEMVGAMVKAGERAADLTRQLLAFSRQQVLAPRVLDLNVVVADLEKMLRRIIGEDMDLTTTLTPGLGRVKVDPGQIEQVVFNLAVNARDAMPQGGRLTIETQNVELDEEYARRHVGVRSGPHVLLAVSDTGCGMAPEVKARIFEPFFTTKEKGKGTGLGLSTVFGIVQQAGGHVEVYTEPGVGTSLKVYFPRVEEEPDALESVPHLAPSPGGSETVLLVEDEDAVRSLSRIVLQGAGYRVLEAADGAQALVVAAQHEGPIHLLLTDVVMPVLGGRELAERLLLLHPQMKILFQSGYTDDAVVRHGILQETVHFLQKPFTPAALALKVREVLDVEKVSGTFSLDRPHDRR